MRRIIQSLMMIVLVSSCGEPKVPTEPVEERVSEACAYYCERIEDVCGYNVGFDDCPRDCTESTKNDPCESEIDTSLVCVASMTCDQLAVEYVEPRTQVHPDPCEDERLANRVCKRENQPSEG